MLGTNPFSILAETVSPFAMQSFIIAMIVLIALGTIIQMIHHKNITYFFNNAKKAKAMNDCITINKYNVNS